MVVCAPRVYPRPLFLFWWAGQDLNLRAFWEQIYSLLVSTTHTPARLMPVFPGCHSAQHFTALVYLFGGLVFPDSTLHIIYATLGLLSHVWLYLMLTIGAYSMCRIIRRILTCIIKRSCLFNYSIPNQSVAKTSSRVILYGLS